MPAKNSEKSSRVAIVVGEMRITREPPPQDAIPVESIKVDVEGAWKKILSVYQNVHGESKPTRLLVKFWSEPVDSEAAGV